MEEQSSGEFASADAAAGAQDAAVQERGFSPEIPVNACRRLQHLQRPTSSHFSPNAPRASRCGDGHMADRRRSSLTIPEPPTLRARPNGNVTSPAGVLTVVDLGSNMSAGGQGDGLARWRLRLRPNAL